MHGSFIDQWGNPSPPNEPGAFSFGVLVFGFIYLENTPLWIAPVVMVMLQPPMDRKTGSYLRQSQGWQNHPTPERQRWSREMPRGGGNRCCQRSLMLCLMTTMTAIAPVAAAIPPETEIPEEVLRTEMITGARSPIDGKPMSPSEYAEFQAQIQTPAQQPAQVAPEVRELIGLLRLRKFIKTFFPFLPIK